MISRSESKIDDKNLVAKLQTIDHLCTYNEDDDTYCREDMLLKHMEWIKSDQKPTIDLNLKTSSIQRKMHRGDGQFKELARLHNCIDNSIIHTPQDQLIAYASQTVHSC